MIQREDNPIAGQLHAMKQRMEVLYSKSFNDSEEVPRREESFQPPVDVWETGSAWLILVDLPGVQEEDFHVEFSEDRLTIRGHRKSPPLLDGTAAAPLERSQGAFSRSFVLPPQTQADAIKAELKHGVLTVTIAKDRGQSSASQQIQVKAG